MSHADITVRTDGFLTGEHYQKDVTLIDGKLYIVSSFIDRLGNENITDVIWLDTPEVSKLTELLKKASELC